MQPNIGRSRRHLLALLPAPLLVLAMMPAGGIPAGATNGPAPLTSTFADHFAVTPCPPTAPAKALCAMGRGRGVVSHLGAATEAISATAILARPDPVTGCAPEFATVRLTLPGGQIALHLTGQFCQTSARTSIEVGYYLVTGGVGRFRGATGQGTYEFSGRFDSKTSGTATHMYRGTVTL